jgi:hypothetical protein
MNTRITRVAALTAGLLTIGLAGCSQYVKQSDFNTAIQQLQQKQTDQQQQIDAIKQQMQSQFAKYDSQITAMQGRVSIDTVAHFAFNSATLSEQDKPALQDFAATIGKYHPGVLITVGRLCRPGRLACLQQEARHAARRCGARFPDQQRPVRRSGTCGQLR